MPCALCAFRFQNILVRTWIKSWTYIVIFTLFSVNYHLRLSEISYTLRNPRIKTTLLVIWKGVSKMLVNRVVSSTFPEKENLKIKDEMMLHENINCKVQNRYCIWKAKFMDNLLRKSWNHIQLRRYSSWYSSCFVWNAWNKSFCSKILYYLCHQIIIFVISSDVIFCSNLDEEKVK